MQLQALSTSIPADRLLAVEKALLHVFNTTDLADIKLLAGGFSTLPVYKITVGNQSYVLKLDNPATAVATAAFPASGSSCMEIAANAGVAPPLYYLNTADAISITLFIENKPLRSVYPSPDTLLGELASTIRSIHALPRFTKENGLRDTVESLIGQVKELPVFTTSIFEDLFDYYAIIRKHYPWDDTDKVPSHNDLNPNNLICDGKRIWVVDWDSAFLNDRYVDLAIAANFFVSGEAQEKLFLEAYFGEALSPYNSARFFIMRQICRLVYAILMFKLAYASDPAGTTDDPDLPTLTLKKVGEQMGTGKLSLSSYRGQLFFGKALLNEALTDMLSGRFVPSVDLVSQPAEADSRV